MQQLEQMVGKITGFMDKLAGLALLMGMLLVVANVVLRVTLGRPILGTYEYVGFITTAIIALALAHCAWQNGHLAVGFIMDKFMKKVRLAVDTAVHLVAIFFFMLFAYHVFDYASTMIMTGEVSPTTKTPFYPFVWLVGAGLSALCVVLLVRLIKMVRGIGENG